MTLDLLPKIPENIKDWLQVLSLVATLLIATAGGYIAWRQRQIGQKINKSAFFTEAYNTVIEIVSRSNQKLTQEQTETDTDLLGGLKIKAESLFSIHDAHMLKSEIQLIIDALNNLYKSHLDPPKSEDDVSTAQQKLKTAPTELFKRISHQTGVFSVGSNFNPFSVNEQIDQMFSGSQDAIKKIRALNKLQGEQADSEKDEGKPSS